VIQVRCVIIREVTDNLSLGVCIPKAMFDEWSIVSLKSFDGKTILVHLSIPEIQLKTFTTCCCAPQPYDIPLIGRWFAGDSHARLYSGALASPLQFRLGDEDSCHVSAPALRRLTFSPSFNDLVQRFVSADWSANLRRLLDEGLQLAPHRHQPVYQQNPGFTKELFMRLHMAICYGIFFGRDRHQKGLQYLIELCVEQQAAIPNASSYIQRLRWYQQRLFH
jgi:hypothetical protein